MGCDISTEQKSDLIEEQIKFRSLSPYNLIKIKENYQKEPNFSPDKNLFISMSEAGKKETNILYDFFDMDGNGQIDSYEFICIIAMLLHSSNELRSELLFKIYDLNSDGFITRDELIYFVRNSLIACKKTCSNSEVEKKTDEFLRLADLDLDKKLSFREFQNHLFKNREYLVILDNYYILSNDVTNNFYNDKSNVNLDNNNIKDDYTNPNNNNFVEENYNADELDPDLMTELNRKTDDNETQEAVQKIKEGAEFNVDQNTGMFKIEITNDATEFSATKPWMGVVLNSVPSDYKPKKSDSEAPSNQLELEFIHGYRTHDTRNNLRYTSNGDIVYHTAAVGIVYNKESHEQRFMFDHIDDIISLAVNPIDKNIIATGEIGPYPLICIWDASTNCAKVRITGPLTKGITHLSFSPDGKYLVATSMHDDHHVAVFDWEKGNNLNISDVKGKQKLTASESPVIATGKGTRAHILGIAVSKKNDIALTCVKEVSFVSFKGGKISLKKGTGMKNIQSILCGDFFNNTLITGTFSGELYLWSGTSFNKSVKGHKGCVNCIYVNESTNSFLTGGNDGNIIRWDNKFVQSIKISIINDEINSLSPKVRSVCEGENGEILIGTRGGEIIEFVNKESKVLLRGHFDKELWALACHPKKDKFFTVGQDMMLALWDVKSKRIEAFTTVPEPIEVMDVSPNAKTLALGIKTGSFYIYDAVNLTQKLKKNDRKQPISEIKFSPNGEFLVVGSVDFMIFVYDKAFNLLKKMKGHVSRVTHIDFSEDSNILQSNSTSYDVLFHNLSSGKQVPNGASSFKDEIWNSYTCVLGWAVQGIWPPCASGDDINAVDRDKDHKVIATADDWGKVKLFKYPNPVERSSFNRYVGHSSHVTNVRFTKTNNYLISTGGNDKAIFQWKHIREDANIDTDDEEARNRIDEEEDNPDVGEENIVGNFKIEEISEGDQFGVSKPFLGEVKASTPKDYRPNKNSADAPNNNLELRYVHGYRAFDTRNNVKYTNDDNKIVFHAAALGIVLEKSSNSQTFFKDHDEDVVSLAIHPNRNIIATGQMAKAGKAKLIDIYVWDIDEKKPLANLKGFHLRAIRNLAFSPNGSKLLSGGEDDDNSVAVYDWQNSKIICSSPVDKARVTELAFSSENEFVTIGLKHIKFFSLNGRNISGKKGIFGSVKQEALICLAYVGNVLLTGDAKGNLIIWNGRSATKSIKAHKGPTYVLYYNAGSKENVFYSGGADGIVNAYDIKYNLKFNIDTSKMSPFKLGIRSIDINNNINCMLLATSGGDIIEISSISNYKVNNNYKVLLSSHYDTELWAVTVHPNNSNLFATGGGDSTLRVWDVKKNKMIKHLILDQDFRAIDWSSNGKYLIVASMLGKIYYVDYASFKVVYSIQSMFKGSKQWIQEMKISPDNEYVAYGSHGGVSKVEILKVVENDAKPLKSYCIIDPRFTSSLTHLDWSEDSSNIVVNSLAFELKFLSLDAKKLVSASAACDIKWNTWTCIFGFPVQGIWPPASTGYVVNYSCKSNSDKILATGDDFGLVKLFKYPCTIEKANYREFKGHSSHIPKIRFSKNDCYLFSTGGNDKSVFVWETDFGNNEMVDDNNEDDEDNHNKESCNDEEDEEDEEDGEEEEDNVDFNKKNIKKTGNLNNKTKTKQTKIQQDNFEEEDEDDKPVNNKSLSKNNKKNNKKQAIISNDEDEEQSEEEIVIVKKPKKKKKVVVVEESEEDEDEILEEEIKSNEKAKSKAAKQKQKQAKKPKKQIVDEDEDDYN